MVIHTRCPNAACRKPLKVKSENAGKRLKCPGCGGPIQVAELSAFLSDAEEQGEAADGLHLPSALVNRDDWNSGNTHHATDVPAKRAPPPLPSAVSADAGGLPGRQTVSEPPPLPNSAPPASAASRSGWLRWTALAISAIAVIALISSFARPLTAREVCERVEAAKSATDAEPHVTKRVLALLVDMLRQEGLQPKAMESVEWLGEEDVPAHVGGRYVYCRGRSWQSAGGDSDVVQMAFYLVKTDAWRIEDLLVLGMNGEQFDSPVSMVAAHKQGVYGTPTSPEKAASDAQAQRRLKWQQGESLRRETSHIPGMVYLGIALIGGICGLLGLVFKK